MRDMLKSDIESLEEVIGEEVSYDDLNSVAMVNPKLFI